MIRIRAYAHLASGENIEVGALRAVRLVWKVRERLLLHEGMVDSLRPPDPRKIREAAKPGEQRKWAQKWTQITRNGLKGGAPVP